MKSKIIILGVSTLLLMSLVGCSQTKETQIESVIENIEENTTEHATENIEENTTENQTEKSSIHVTFISDKEALKNDEGTIVLNTESSFPVIEGKPEEVVKRIQESLDQDIQQYQKQVEETYEYAKEDFRFRASKDYEMMPYEETISFQEGLCNDKVLSLVSEAYSFTGGAHGGMNVVGYNFSVETGEKITLQNISTNEEEFRSRVTEAILKQITEKKMEESLFGDYEELVAVLLGENNWYLSEEGFVVIANQYAIAPYVTGILEFTIPYNELNMAIDVI